VREGRRGKERRKAIFQYLLHTKLDLRENKLRKEGNIPVSFAYEVRFKGKQVKEGSQYSSIFCIRS